VTSIGEIVTALKDYSADVDILWYRGHAKEDWSLIPTIGRNPSNLAGELTVIKVFKQRSRPYLPAVPISEWEWIFLMQHHRAPTRLLDWSASPLTALYFALFDPMDEYAADDAALWVLDPITLNRHSGHRKSFARDILAFGVDGALEQYLPDQVNSRIADLDPVAAIGPQNSARMAAQSGSFTIMHATATDVRTVGDGSHIWRMIIPAGSKAALRAELTLLGITDEILFPDLDRVAAAARGLLA
jgi:hypothetical protein